MKYLLALLLFFVPWVVFASGPWIGFYILFGAPVIFTLSIIINGVLFWLLRWLFIKKYAVIRSSREWLWCLWAFLPTAFIFQVISAFFFYIAIEGMVVYDIHIPLYIGYTIFMLLTLILPFILAFYVSCQITLIGNASQLSDGRKTGRVVLMVILYLIIMTLMSVLFAALDMLSFIPHRNIYLSWLLPLTLIFISHIFSAYFASKFTCKIIT